MRVRLPFAILAVVASFGSGLASSQWVREAHAQSQPFAATIYVPSDGLAFRTFDGRVVAKLSYNAHGGAFQLYDEHEQPTGPQAAAPGAVAVMDPGAASPPSPPAPFLTADPLEDRQ